MSSEAQHLAEIYDEPIQTPEEWAADVKEEIRWQAIKYAQNRKAKVGIELKCPVCSAQFKKKSYQHAFCQKKKSGRSGCKDKFWNRVRFWNNEAAVEALLEKLDEIQRGDRDIY